MHQCPERLRVLLTSGTMTVRVCPDVPNTKIMFTKNYYSAIQELAERAPDLEGGRGATKYFAWAELVVEVLAVVYTSQFSDDIMDDLTEAVKAYQEYEDADEDSDEDAT